MSEPKLPWVEFTDDINAAIRKRHDDMRPTDAMKLLLDIAGAIIACAPIEQRDDLYAEAMHRLSDAAGMQMKLIPVSGMMRGTLQ